MQLSGVHRLWLHGPAPGQDQGAVLGGDGFLLLYKRLEKGSFQWPWTKDAVRTLTPQQYRWLMEGLETEQPKANKMVTGPNEIQCPEALAITGFLGFSFLWPLKNYNGFS